MEEKIERTLAGTLAMIIFLPLIYLLWGVCFMNLWNWFVSPLTGVTLSLVTAIGLGVLKAFLSKRNYEEAERTEAITLIVRGLLSHSMYLLIGWIVTLFI